MEEHYLKVDEVAERLNVSKMTVYRLIHSGGIECFKAGPRAFRIPARALNEYIENRTRGRNG